jgi:hypothetical protein
MTSAQVAADKANTVFRMPVVAFINLSFNVKLYYWLHTYAHYAHKSPMTDIIATIFQRMLLNCNKQQHQMPNLID